MHILCGINDIAENEGAVDDATIQRNLAAMLTETRAQGLATWIGSILPADRVPWRAHVLPKPRIAAMNAWLRDAAPAHGARYLDYHAVLATSDGGLRPECSADGLHLSEAGYAVMEPLLLAALAERA